jgi:hypothetical protein
MELKGAKNNLHFRGVYQLARTLKKKRLSN